MLNKKGILSLKSGQFPLGVRGRSVPSVIRTVSVPYSKMKTSIMYLSCSYSDPLFYEECKTEYLKQREEYRATGIKKKRQKVTSNV